jgi:hypothetical protein
MPLSKTFDDALVYAADLHRNQIEKEAAFRISLTC